MKKDLGHSFPWVITINDGFVTWEYKLVGSGGNSIDKVVTAITMGTDLKRVSCRKCGTTNKTKHCTSKENFSKGKKIRKFVITFHEGYAPKGLDKALDIIKKLEGVASIAEFDPETGSIKNNKKSPEILKTDAQSESIKFTNRFLEISGQRREELAAAFSEAIEWGRQDQKRSDNAKE